MTTPYFNDFYPSHIINFISDRSIDYKFAPGASPAFSSSQKEFLDDQLQFDLPQVVNIQQVHGNRVVVATEDSPQRVETIEEADGLVTNRPNVPLAIRTADCVPVFMYDPKNNAVGLIHAGWQSTQKQIVKEALRIMKENYQTDPEDLKVSFGPAIQAKSFEVEEDFENNFPGKIVVEEGKRHFDVPKENREQLNAGGVPDENILDCGIDTYSDEGCFSFRKEQDKAGRMLSLIMIKG